MAVEVVAVLIDLEQAKFDALHLREGLWWVDLHDHDLVGFYELVDHLLCCILKLFLLRPKDLVDGVVNIYNVWLIITRFRFELSLLEIIPDPRIL